MTIISLPYFCICTSNIYIENLCNLSLPDLPVLPHLIWGKDLASNPNYKAYEEAVQPEPPKASNPFFLNVSREEAEKIASNVVEEYKLNRDQIRYGIPVYFATVINVYCSVLKNCMAWFKFVDTHVDSVQKDVDITDGDEEDEMSITSLLEKKKESSIGVDIKTKPDGGPIVSNVGYLL